MGILLFRKFIVYEAVTKRVLGKPERDPSSNLPDRRSIVRSGAATTTSSVYNLSEIVSFLAAVAKAAVVLQICVTETPHLPCHAGSVLPVTEERAAVTFCRHTE
jgi:hypothetical protein